ncbi:MAG: hypothetical protein PQJ44_05220 [Sphaerochaetaceae bacterium]|nr:hypothetical protein [Sphaerochaetaceae bacterium]
MEIKIKSNNRHIILPTIVFLIVFGAINIYFLYAQMKGILDIGREIGMFLTTTGIFLVLAYICIYFKFIQSKYFIFSKNKIYVYKKEQVTKTIEVDKISSMNYYPFRIHYIITIYLGALKEGGAWKIHIKDIYGIKHEIGFISEKEAINLRNQLYPNLLVIKFDRYK